MESPLMTSGQPHAPGNDVPDRCLLLSDSRKRDEEFHDLIPIWDHKILKIGRDPDSDLFIRDDAENLVSRTHCEVYVVEYDQTDSLVYVRDRNSSNGTYVNDIRVGDDSRMSSGYLLEHGDIIELRPHWRLTFCDKRPQPRYPLTDIQRAETRFFEDKYLLTQRCLGQGADGIVYLAVEVATKKQVVCKLVNLRSTKDKNDKEELRRKLQETDVLRQLQHPNIVPYIDAVISPYSLYTFTELATGGDLWSFIHRHGTETAVGENESRVIIRQIVCALYYLHMKGVVHRDLKPENILLAYSPWINCHRVMLSDFGACAVPRRSRMLTRAGTPNFQAPEISKKHQAQTFAVDMWSLGVVALTLLTHHMDIGIQALDQLSQQWLDIFLDNSVFGEADDFTPACERFVRGCLRIGPEERLSAAAAQDHDWLCKPEKYLDWFQELDRKATGDWKIQILLKPMAFELPDVLGKHRAKSEFEQQLLRLSDRFDPEKCSQYLHSERRRPDKSVPEGIRNRDPSFFESIPSMEPRVNTSITDTTPINLPASRDGAYNPGEPAYSATMLNQAVPRRLKRCKVRIKEAALLPFPGLERQTDPGVGVAATQREQVIETLKRADAGFVVDKPTTSTLPMATGRSSKKTCEQAKPSTSITSPFLLR
ncbi:hypothetical protein DCS_02578 [Drechmeria coniospora]|uniref:Protein kinase-like domain protein n=1 Tax=Drechmeria coniospora TaxID=98403 RepID=A0A151GWE9_DRECN|nr:hypothetical protein DCS_02578 [Drechmeria coniospora]KYK61436.1 hypothetical protein DCS_02578 [Drechmeria coniospora]